MKSGRSYKEKSGFSFRIVVTSVKDDEAWSCRISWKAGVWYGYSMIVNICISLRYICICVCVCVKIIKHSGCSTNIVCVVWCVNFQKAWFNCHSNPWSQSLVQTMVWTQNFKNYHSSLKGWHSLKKERKKERAFSLVLEGIREAYWVYPEHFP